MWFAPISAPCTYTENREEALAQSLKMNRFSGDVFEVGTRVAIVPGWWWVLSVRRDRGR